MSETEAKNGTSCDWTVTGMDCGSCATKIKDAVARLPGVTGVEVGTMSERLRLTLDDGETGRDKIEKTVRALGYGIEPRVAMAAPDEAVDQGASFTGHSQADGKAKDHSGHGGPGHGHDEAADRGKRWYQTAKGRLVIFTALLLMAAWGVELIVPEVGNWAFVAACLIGVALVARRAFAALRMGQPFTIESLMTVAAIGALFIKAAEEAAGVKVPTILAPLIFFWSTSIQVRAEEATLSQALGPDYDRYAATVPRWISLRFRIMP